VGPDALQVNRDPLTTPLAGPGGLRPPERRFGTGISKTDFQAVQFEQYLFQDFTVEVTNPDSLPTSKPDQPGRVVKLYGVIVQSDKTSWLGAWLIRPIEMLDLHLAGIGRKIDGEPLAMHAGLHVGLEDGREFVVEQLFGTPREDFVNGLNWTPLETFRARDHQGWDVTLPPTCFRKIDENIVNEVIEFVRALRTGTAPYPSIEDIAPSVQLCFQLAEMVAKN